MDHTFDTFQELNIRQNRCCGYTKSGKKCRSRLKEAQYLFCCEDHKPYNAEIMEDGCFCCMEKIINHKDSLFFKCKHLVHKSCYLDWLKSENNTYEEPVCLICRNTVFEHARQKKKKAIPYTPNSLNDEGKPSIESMIEEKLLDIQIHDEKNQKEVKKFLFGDQLLLLE